MIIALNALTAAVFAALVAACAVRAKKEKEFAYPYLFLGISFAILFFVSLSNVLERTIRSETIDKIEEYLEILIVPFILLFAYSWSVTEREKRIEGYARELHHRVKNNLQVVENMIELQALEAGGDAAESLSVARERVAAIGLCERLSFERRGSGEIDMDRYLGAVARRLCGIAALARKGIRIDVDCRAIHLPPYEALPCAMMLLETAIKMEGTHLRARIERLGERRFSYTLAGMGRVSGGMHEALMRSFAGQLRAETAGQDPLVATFTPTEGKDRKWTAPAF